MKALSIRDLKKTYGTGLEALKGISLDVEEGDFFALLGPNGAGKSTAIGIISSLVTKSSGKISVFGHDLDDEPEAVKSYIGLVPQEFNFNQFETPFDIILSQAGFYGIPRKEALKNVEECLKALSLWDKRSTVSRMLSGGMKRRLMIARALVHKPKLLILDEPTAGVDIEIRRSMWKFLRKINRNGTTIILTTHYLEEAESLCRHIGIINQGELIECSDMTSLLARLDTERFIFNLAEPLPLEVELSGYKVVTNEDATLTVEVGKEQGLSQLFGHFGRHNIDVLSMRNESNRLEQLFIDLVTDESPDKHEGRQ
jgi:ABC-2 type transport system ATP-binding protein